MLLPRGAAIQVTGEESYLSTLAPLAGEHGESWIYVTLHELVKQLARSTRTLVEVRVDGAPAGCLTPKMSGELLPAIRHFTEQGLLTAARAMVKGNRLKADVVLYTARSGELPAEWLECPQPAAPAANRADRQAEPAWRFNAPPGWPEPPSGWIPPPGWTVPPDFPTPPGDWQWWLPITPRRDRH